MESGERKERFFKKLFSKSLNTYNEQSNGRSLKELCIYMLFLAVTTIITLSGRDIGMFYLNEAIDRIFLQSPPDNEETYEYILSFGDVVTLDDWWTYVESSFVEGIAKFQNKNSSFVLSDGGNVLFGSPRIRQIRVKNESCIVDESFVHHFKVCYPPYSESKEETNEYFGKKHLDQSDLGCYSLRGTLAQYRGGGYLEMLTEDKEENKQIIAQLKEMLWIDSATRVILLEFAIFNANVNLFCNAKLIAEISATGGMVTSSFLQSIKLSALWNEGEYMEMLYFGVFVVLIVYYTIDTVGDVMKLGYISSVLSYLRLCNIGILLIAYFSIAYLIWHRSYMKSLLKKYATNNEEYLSLDTICIWNLTFTDAIGVCAFLVWIQIFKYIKFNKTMLQFSTTLKRCAMDLWGFSIMFAIVLIAYANLSIFIFGSALADFKDFSSAFLTLIRMVLGDFDYEHLEKANRILGPVFFLTFILFVFLILMNMFLAIINETYTDVKSGDTIEEVNQFGEYIKTLFSKIRNSLLLPLKRMNNEKKQSRTEVKHVKIIRKTPLYKQTFKTSQEKKVKTQKDVLESVFELLPTNIENDVLNERVVSLERQMNKLIKGLDLILDITKPTGKNISNRSL